LLRRRSTHTQSKVLEIFQFVLRRLNTRYLMILISKVRQLALLFRLEMCDWLLVPGICEFFLVQRGISLTIYSYALAADIQTIPGLPTAPGYLNVDIDTETGEIDGLF
jgi:hypothetical protein